MTTTSKDKQPALEQIGPNVWYFNYNHRQQREIIPPMEEDGEPTEAEVWVCDTVRIEGTPTYESAVKAAIRAMIDESAEFALINAYYSVQLGIIEGEAAVKAVDEYTEYLRRVAEIKQAAKEIWQTTL